MGRVDLTRAVSQQAYGTPAALNLGAIRYAEEGAYEPVERAVTVHNTSGAERTFTIEDTGVNARGQAIPDDALTASATSVTVPAGGSADVAVALDPTPWHATPPTAAGYPRPPRTASQCCTPSPS